MPATVAARLSRSDCRRLLSEGFQEPELYLIMWLSVQIKRHTRYTTGPDFHRPMTKPEDLLQQL